MTLPANIVDFAASHTLSPISIGETDRKIINAIMHKKLREVKEIRIDYASSALANDLSQPEFFLKGDKVVLLIACYLNKVRLIDNMVVTI